MKLTVPCLYIGYGRYISRFRGIPYTRDCLALAERRILLGFHDLAKNYNKKLFKSLKVVGHVLGNYHPHGDLSTYGTLAQMVENGMIDGEGNWGVDGLLGREKPAAMRYTECRMKKWVYDLAFKNIKYIPEDNIEFEVEKLFLSSPIPIGLIGKDVITGISFHRALIPRFKFEDLKNRLYWLLVNYQTYMSNKDNPENWNENTVGPIIIPNIPNCDQFTTNQELYNLLITGKQSIVTAPQCEINEKKREIHIKGWVPNSRQNHYLLTLCKPDETTKEPAKFDYTILDITKKQYHVKLTLPRKSNIQDVFKQIYDKYLKTNISYETLLHDDNGNIVNKGIDELLIESYIEWCKISLIAEIDEFNKLYEKYFQNYIMQCISYILNQSSNLKKVEEIVLEFDELVLAGTLQSNIVIEMFDVNQKKFIQHSKIITEEDIIKVCISNNIKKLIEASIDLNGILQEITDQKKRILENDQYKFNEFCNLKI